MSPSSAGSKPSFADSDRVTGDGAVARFERAIAPYAHRFAEAPAVLALRESLPVALDFIRTTGIDVFAPAIGNAHGVYHSEPKLDAQRVSDIVAAQPIPIALHGGTGMTDAQFTDLIARGCAKVNISTALKVTYMKANLAFLRGAEERDSWDPPSLFSATRTAVKDMAADHMRRFGSIGRAW